MSVPTHCVANINAVDSQCRGPRATRFAWDNVPRKTGCCVREILSIRGPSENA